MYYVIEKWFWGKYTTHRPRGTRGKGAYPRAKNIGVCDANVFLMIYHLHRRNFFDKNLSTMELRRKDEASNSTIRIRPYYGSLFRSSKLGMVYWLQKILSKLPISRNGCRLMSHLGAESIRFRNYQKKTVLKFFSRSHCYLFTFFSV